MHFAQWADYRRNQRSGKVQRILVRGWRSTVTIETRCASGDGYPENQATSGRRLGYLFQLGHAASSSGSATTRPP